MLYREALPYPGRVSCLNVRSDEMLKESTNSDGCTIAFHPFASVLLVTNDEAYDGVPNRVSINRLGGVLLLARGNRLRGYH